MGVDVTKISQGLRSDCSEEHVFAHEVRIDLIKAEIAIVEAIHGDETDQTVDFAEADSGDGLVDGADAAAAVNDAITHANDARREGGVDLDMFGDLVETYVNLLQQHAQPGQDFGSGGQAACNLEEFISGKVARHVGRPAWEGGGARQARR